MRAPEPGRFREFSRDFGDHVGTAFLRHQEDCRIVPYGAIKACT